MREFIRNYINRAEINRTNAQHSTGPVTESGKARVRMNAFQHGFTGQYLMVTEAEKPFYNRLSQLFAERYQPADIVEKEILQKIIDSHWRLNRLAALESNLFSVELGAQLRNREEAPGDDRSEAIHAQTRAWIERGDSIEKLGRYEGRLHRILFQLTAELERVQANRVQANHVQTAPAQPVATSQPEQNETVQPQMALFCKPARSVAPAAPREPAPLSGPAPDRPSAPAVSSAPPLAKAA